MKNLILAALLMMPSLLCAQSVESGMKVKREKTNKIGILVKGGYEQISFANYEGSGFSGGAYFMCQGLMKPRNPECRWGFEFGIGFGLAKADVSYNASEEGGSDDNVTLYRLFEIPLSVKYILNPLSAHGKWNINAGGSICPLVVGVPEVYEGLSNRYHVNPTNMGISESLNLGIAYEAKHWGLGLNGFFGFTTPWDSEGRGENVTSLGGTLSFRYLF